MNRPLGYVDVMVIDYQDGGYVMVIIPKEMETLDKVERLEKEVERLRSVEVEVANNVLRFTTICKTRDPHLQKFQPQ